jgi:hypothetical protein
MPLSQRVDSVESFTHKTIELRNEWMSRSDMAILPWFRGQADSEWRLVPKFYRSKPVNLTTELEIREEFITHAPALSDLKPANEWEWYFLMQHYGAPTRLLDWTDGALIALYFAVRDNSGDRHAAVWALDPWTLNIEVVGKDEVIPPGDAMFISARRKEHAWLPKRVGRPRSMNNLPIAVFPGHFDRRIGSQRSSFTVHGKYADGLLKWAETNKYKGLRRFVIPSWEVKQIRRALDGCGIDETTVFPNLDALSRVVEFRWKERKEALPHTEVYTRLKPSKIHGVGVFAIKNIPKGTRLFADDLGEMVWVEEAKIKRLPKELRRLYEDFSPQPSGRFGCPRNFNRLTMSWYLNESANPNVGCVGNYDFGTLRDIKAGEELTLNYSLLPDSIV